MGVLSRQRPLAQARPEDPETHPPTTSKARSPCEKSQRLLAIFLLECFFLYFCAIRELKAKEILAPQDFANLLQFLNCESTAL